MYPSNIALPHGGAWHLLGVVGALIFYSRFYVQWLASERVGRSTIPEVFWHMSTIGSLALLVYAIATQSPLGALGQCFNLVVYSRNLVHLWRNRLAISPSSIRLFHFLVAVVTMVSVAFVVTVWTHEFHINKDAAPAVARQTWLWLGIGVIGQILFACRFLIQWIATERNRACTVPVTFWHLSLVATALQIACFVQRAEWIFAVGSAAVILIYFRNLSLLKNQAQEATSKS